MEKQYRYFVEFNNDGTRQEGTIQQLMKYVYIEHIEPLMKEATKKGVAVAVVPTRPDCEIHRLIKDAKLYVEYV